MAVGKPKGQYSGSTAYWVWCLLLLLLCVGLGAQLWLIATSGASEGIKADENGRRYVLDVATGHIKGGAPAASAEPKKEPAAEPAPETKPEVKEEPAPEAKEEPKEAPQSEPAPEAQAPATQEPEPAVAENTPPPATPTAEVDALPKPIDTSESLPPAPIAALSETSDAGSLPKVGEDGTKPWQAYARPFSKNKGNQPVIAIIVTGLGHNKIIAENASQLPGPVTLSYSPYASASPSWMKAVRAMGHETLLDLPLEPADFPASDPGPQALLGVNSSEDNVKRLQWSLSRFSGYVGVYANPMEKFTANKEASLPILSQINQRGLVLVMGNHEITPDHLKLLEESSLPMLLADSLIDRQASSAAISKELSALEAIARKRGYAVGVASAYPITIRELQRWSEGLKSRGFQLAPVSAIIRMKYS